MGTETTGFVHCDGLDIRVKRAERIDQHKTDRLIRMLGWPRATRDEFWKRVFRWQAYIFTKYGTGRQLTYEENIARRKEQIQINQRNEQFREEYPDFG